MRSRINNLWRTAEDLQGISWLFLRFLGLIYLTAFASLAFQVVGLVGEQGILPLLPYMQLAEQSLGARAHYWLPMIYWWTGGSDTILLATAWAGVAGSLLLILGHWERPVLILLFVLYLSLVHAGQLFMNFQWDTLLLEAGFLAIFLPGGPTLLLVILFEWLLFRLRFLSGLFKLLSGDPSWSGLDALRYYFETQPLPHIGSWYAQQFPQWLHQAGTGLTLFSELIVPFFILLTPKFRYAAAAITILMQLLILATSNHNFVNFLTIALCLFLLNDRILAPLLPARFRNAEATPPKPAEPPGRPRNILITIIFLLIVPTSLLHAVARIGPMTLPDIVQTGVNQVQRFGLGQGYHIFPTMQTDRQELIIQGSQDGRNWSAYEFRYKPGDPALAPVFNVPHQPRLDWMLWFVPTQQSLQMAWFAQFMQRLHEGSPSVLKLLKSDPFPQGPPRYLRVLVYRYQFTSSEVRQQTGLWWQRTYLGEFPRLPPRVP
ncbi:MAG: lipase maturation factor family protein [Candidatus Thiodiazotropha sp.]